MPSRQQLEAALIGADKAGDTQAATMLANALKNNQFDNAAPRSSEFPDPSAPADGKVETISGKPLAPDRTLLQEAGDYGQALIAGANRLVPSLAGIPIDTATNIRNLGAAGYGYLKHKLTGSFDVPETVDPSDQFGGSASFQRGFQNVSSALGGGDPFAVPDPTDRTQQNLALAGTVLASGLVNPASGAKQALGNVGKMALPAAGAVAAREIAPDNELAPAIGMIAAPASIAGLKAVLPATSPKEAFIKANKLGYKIPPSLAKESKTQDFLSGAAGNVPLKQKASIHNQKITNDLAKQEIGYPKELNLSPEGLADIRRTAGAVYEKAKNSGTFKADHEYAAELSAIANKNSALATEIPGMVKKDVVGLVEMFNKPQISSEAMVEAVKQLRADSSAGFRSQDPGVLAMAKANGKLANALEGLMERSIQKTNPKLVPELRAARQKIAKTYTIEKSLKGENVDAVALGRLLDRNKPLSGNLRDIAEFGQNFKGAAQVNPPQNTNFRPADLITGIGGATAFQDPKILATMFVRPATRAILLSGKYQKMLAKASPDKLAKITALSKQANPAALIQVLNEINRSAVE